MEKNKCLKIFFDKQNAPYHLQEQTEILQLGLHMGTSIEGAIGSRHKIDVSYLSPNVNLASRVC